MTSPPLLSICTLTVLSIACPETSWCQKCNEERLPFRHLSVEADMESTNAMRDQNIVTVSAWALEQTALGRAFPEWVNVEADPIATLYGTVTHTHNKPNSYVSDEDMPSAHYTNDVCFKVVPDNSPCYENLLGMKIDFENQGECVPEYLRLAKLLRRLGPDGILGSNTARGDIVAQASSLIDGLRGTPCDLDRFNERQTNIEVEWECGLGARPERNPCSTENRRGNSGGFFSEGHKRREVIWNWPSSGDRVCVIGNWVWDRGHPPAGTEIHPPRIVAIERRLPEFLTSVGPPGDMSPPRQLLATRIDVFGSGDGGALMNNRNLVPYAQASRMADRDYVIELGPRLTRPSPQAELKWMSIARPGNTFPAGCCVETVTLFPDGTPEHPWPFARFQIPWKTCGVVDQAMFARSYWLYWDEGNGTIPTTVSKKLKVTIDNVTIHKTHDDLGSGPDGEYRLYASVGSNWLFLNEFIDCADILTEGLGDATTNSDNFTIAPGTYPINKSVLVTAVGHEDWDLYVGGSEVDCVGERLMGKLLDPNATTEQISEWGNDFPGGGSTDGMLTHACMDEGCGDDPVGFVLDSYTMQSGWGIGAHSTVATGSSIDQPVCGVTVSSDSFSITYHVEEIP